ncbi:hypothetical protein FRC19_009097 [Serendipita sp. 401]|nr:hypothetical protein FRC19_009097 [Serendipita sp. 401]
MSVVQRWLREASQPYLHANLVYNDVDSALESHPSVRPKTDVYTYDDGRTELLLCVHGLLPISFRGASYNIPISVWLPQEYPKAVPIVYVVPTSDMLVRASKSVDPSGRCNFPYMENWERKSETCNLRELLDIMQEHFSREPPLYAKPRQTTARVTPQATQSTPTPISSSSSPPPPPRPGPRYVEGGSSEPRRTDTSSFGSPSYRPPPPLPTQATSSSPAPPRALSPTQYQSHHRGTPNQPPSRPMSVISPAQTGQSWTPGHVSHQSLPSFSPPPPPSQGLFQTPQPQPTPQWHSGTGGTPSPQQYIQTPYQHPVPMATSPPPPPPPQVIPQAITPLAPQPPAPAPIRNLMDEEEMLQEIPKYHSSPPPPVVTAAPPRPMNPQLLALHAQLHQKFAAEFNSFTASITREAEGPRAAQTDLLAGEPAIKDEMARLESVRNVCRTVASRLGATANAAELAVAELKRKGDPEVDEIVCATSIVHNQLINLIAEDHAIEDTIYHLHRALNEGRLELDKFLKTTTRLAEEQFMKRALIERITSQLPMGLRMI